MTKALPPVTEPKWIKFSDGTRAQTSIDSTTGIHSVQCNNCLKVILLTITGNPTSAFTHRKACLRKMAKEKKKEEMRIKIVSFNDSQERPRCIVEPTARTILAVEAQRTPNVIPYSTSLPGPTTAPDWPSRITLPRLKPNPAPSKQFVPPAQTTLCEGLRYSWRPGPIWTTYPFQMHADRNLRWIPISLDETDNVIYFRSRDCQGIVASGSSMGSRDVCHSCQRIPQLSDFGAVEDRALKLRL